MSGADRFTRRCVIWGTWGRIVALQVSVSTARHQNKQSLFGHSHSGLVIGALWFGGTPRTMSAPEGVPQSPISSPRTCTLLWCRYTPPPSMKRTASPEPKPPYKRAPATIRRQRELQQQQQQADAWAAEEASKEEELEARRLGLRTHFHPPTHDGGHLPVIWSNAPPMPPPVSNDRPRPTRTSSWSRSRPTRRSVVGRGRRWRRRRRRGGGMISASAPMAISPITPPSA